MTKFIIFLKELRNVRLYVGLWAMFTASAALASMSGLKNLRNCNCKDQPQEPEVSCEVILAAEREKWKQEKQGILSLMVFYLFIILSC